MSSVRERADPFGMDAEHVDALEGLCIRCRDAEAAEPGGYCPACAVHTRIELAVGLRRLTEYLSSWAAFGEWLAAHGRDPAPA
jgi:hypothetical protein